MWGNTCESYLKPLFRLQKRAIRSISGAHKLAESDPIFKKFKILKLKEIYVYSVQLLMYKYHHNLLPHIFSNFLITNDMIHTYHTRYKHHLRPPRFAAKPACISVRKTGVKSYNYYCDLLNFDCSILSYKISLKRHILCNGITFIT